MEGRKASAGEEELDSGGDESPEEDGESPCEGEAKEDRKAAPEKARVTQAQHFKGRMRGTTGPYRELLGLCIMNNQRGLETGGETWAGLVGHVGPVLSSSLASPACTSALFPPPLPPAQANASLLLLPVLSCCQAQAKAGKSLPGFGDQGTQAGLIQAALVHLCQLGWKEPT